MIHLFIKAAMSGVIVAAASEVARRSPGWGALIVPLPLVSILAMLWLWRDTRDPVRMAAHAEATFWFVLPTLPMFLLMPYLLRHDWSFRSSLVLGCLLTLLLALAMAWLGPRIGIRL